LSQTVTAKEDKMSTLQGIRILYPYARGDFENAYKGTIPSELVNYAPTTGEVTRRYGRKVIVVTVPTATHGYFVPGGHAGVNTPHFKYGLGVGKNVLEMIDLEGNLIARNYWLCIACFRLAGKMGKSRFGPGFWNEKDGGAIFLVRRVQCSTCSHTWAIRTFTYSEL